MNKKTYYYVCGNEEYPEMVIEALKSIGATSIDGIEGNGMGLYYVDSNGIACYAGYKTVLYDILLDYGIEVSVRADYALKAFDKVLGRDLNDDAWRADIFSHYRQGEYPFVCIGNSWIQCIPYEGNEPLLGTNNDPE